MKEELYFVCLAFNEVRIQKNDFKISNHMKDIRPRLWLEYIQNHLNGKD